MDPKSRITHILYLSKGDPQATDLVMTVILKAAGYVGAVVSQEATLRCSRESSSPEEIRELTARLDRNRTIAHDALIDSINICNRYLSRSPLGSAVSPGGVYSSAPVHLRAPVDRAAIGDWAGTLVNDLFTDRRR